MISNSGSTSRSKKLYECGCVILVVVVSFYPIRVLMPLLEDSDSPLLKEPFVMLLAHFALMALCVFLGISVCFAVIGVVAKYLVLNRGYTRMTFYHAFRLAQQAGGDIFYLPSRATAETLAGFDENDVAFLLRLCRMRSVAGSP